eukprot:4661500-Pleurochrysis_carterae.AAC.1
MHERENLCAKSVRERRLCVSASVRQCVSALSLERARAQECAERLLSRRMLLVWRELKAERLRERVRTTRARLQ